MTRIDTVTSCFDALQSHNIARAQEYLSDDVVFAGIATLPVGKAEWLLIHNAMLTAFPDFNFNLSELQEVSGAVHAKMRITGNHTGDLIIPGYRLVEPTFEKITMPAEPIKVSFKGDKISCIEVGYVPNGGIEGILKQVGAGVTAHY